MKKRAITCVSIGEFDFQEMVNNGRRFRRKRGEKRCKMLAVLSQNSNMELVNALTHKTKAIADYIPYIVHRLSTIQLSVSMREQ